MTKVLRFSASGGTLLENVGGRLVPRDPYEVRRQAERWMRDSLNANNEGNFNLARLLARDANAAYWALSAWIEQKKAATGRNPFEDAA